MNSELLISIVNQVIYVPIRHHYKCRAIITYVESTLQIRLFMQNKANFRKSQMNVNKVLTKEYEKKTLGQRGKNKANSKPNKANTKPIKANKMPKQSQFKPNQSQFQTAHLLIDRMKPKFLNFLLKKTAPNLQQKQRTKKTKSYAKKRQSCLCNVILPLTCQFRINSPDFVPVGCAKNKHSLSAIRLEKAYLSVSNFLPEASSVSNLLHCHKYRQIKDIALGKTRP